MSLETCQNQPKEFVLVCRPHLIPSTSPPPSPPVFPAITNHHRLTKDFALCPKCYLLLIAIMVGRQRTRRGRGTARRTVSRSPVIDDTTSKPTEHINNNTITNHTPLAPPPPAPLEAQPRVAPKPMPKPPSSGGSSKRKFDDIAEVSWESAEDKPLPEVSISANASIVTVSERPSRRLRSTYTLAASIASIERTTGTRSRRAAPIERSVTRNPLSSGFSKPNDSEKLVVKARDGRECWLCSQSNTVMLETAHNVVASNRDLV